MDTQEVTHKDIVGVPLAVGDWVATDVMSYKSSHLRVGQITAITGDYLTVQYTLDPPSWRKADKPRKQSVGRYPRGVVKVAYEPILSDL